MSTRLSARLDEAPFDLATSMALQQLGRFDPTVRAGPRVFEKVHADEDGRVLAWCLSCDATSGAVTVLLRSEAAVSDAPLRRFLAQFPLEDGAHAFRPEHPRLARLVRAFPGLRLLRVPWMFDVAIGAVLQQRVAFREAATQFRRIAERFGTRSALGVAFPDARRLHGVPMHELQAIGIDVRRARTIKAIAKEQCFRTFLHDGVTREELRRRLSAIPGVGPWTTAMIEGFGAGDPDAVPVGDLHLPSLVSSVLAGEPRGTDERMLALLAPYAGQRFRVVRLLWSALFHAPHLVRGAR